MWHNKNLQSIEDEFCNFLQCILIVVVLVKRCRIKDEMLKISAANLMKLTPIDCKVCQEKSRRDFDDITPYQHEGLSKDAESAFLIPYYNGMCKKFAGEISLFFEALVSLAQFLKKQTQIFFDLQRPYLFIYLFITFLGKRVRLFLFGCLQTENFRSYVSHSRKQWAR